MSLILEALRKLDRDKQAPERGLIVTGASTWARPEERRGVGLALIVLAGLLLGAAVWLWRGRAGHAPAAVAPAAGSAVSADRGPAGPAPTEAVDASVLTTAAAGAAADARDAQADAARAPRSTAASGRDVPPLREDKPAPAAPAAATAAPADSTPAPAGVAVADTSDGEDARPTASAEDTSTPVAPAPPPGEVVLQAVTERDGQPLAIVNGRLVREGDSFDGIHILRIRATEIDVEVKGQRRTVSF